jgi:DNA-binding transcriptional regulator YhcF (GntR family)
MSALGDLSLVLLGAVEELRTEVRAPTLRDLALHTQVGFVPAAQTMKNLTRRGHVRIVRRRSVGYVNKPVAEYDLPEPDTAGAGVDLGQVVSAWMR